MLTTRDVKEVKLVFISGMNEQGLPMKKSRIYKQVNAASATLDNVYAFGQAVAALSDWPIDQIILSNDSEIVEVLN